MSTALRTAVTLLVLLNLIFVQLTNAVGLHWILPMQILAACSPLWVKLQERLWWRAGWNVGVIAIFAVLVRDTAATGPRYLLEDGLILAAFCQVHLLNVLRQEQKPDLLFFNAFLIALVTSFFCQDVAFSATFAVYAFVFVAALELAADRGRRPARVVVLSSTRRSSVLVAVTALAFVAVPRDFRREGLVGDDALSSFVRSSTSGFAEEIHLDRSAHTTVSERVVMRIRPTSGDASKVPPLWRGAALEWYDSRGWRTVLRQRNGDPASLPWRITARGLWARDGEERARVVVECEDGGARALFAPLGAIQVGIPADAWPDAVHPRADGTFARRLPDDAQPAPWSYSVAIGGAATTAVSATGSSLRPFLHVSPEDARLVPPVLHALLLDATRGMSPDATQAELVERCRTLLEGRFDYLLPGQQGSARDLGAFLSGAGGGHCELFATGLALMLRLRGVPCRIATGYAVHEWDAEQQHFVVRQRHAHAWVEVYDQDRRVWEAVDATPPASLRSDGNTGWIDRLLMPLQEAWRWVTTFDGDSRDRLIARLVALPSSMLAAAEGHPGMTAITIAMIGMLVVFGVRRRRRRRADPVLAYHRATRRVRVRRDPHETPREFLARVRLTAGLPEDAIAELERVTRDHEAARFAPGATRGTPRSSESRRDPLRALAAR